MNTCIEREVTNKPQSLLKINSNILVIYSTFFTELDDLTINLFRYKCQVRFLVTFTDVITWSFHAES